MILNMYNYSTCSSQNSLTSVTHLAGAGRERSWRRINRAIKTLCFLPVPCATFYSSTQVFSVAGCRTIFDAQVLSICPQLYRFLTQRGSMAMVHVILLRDALFKMYFRSMFSGVTVFIEIIIS